MQSIDKLKSDSKLRDTISNIEAKILLLGDEISSDNTQDKIDSAVNRINNIMSEWRNKINFEYKNYMLRFSIKKLTVFVETPNLSLPLNRIGGAENWLACHLFLHLALHKYFIENKRPVPNFLIIDQPTQVHYPENYIETSENRLPSQDEQADKNMFDFIMEVASELSPKLQIIVTDHAHFHYPAFEEKIQAVWRNGERLVPSDWYE